MQESMSYEYNTGTRYLVLSMIYYRIIISTTVPTRVPLMAYVRMPYTILWHSYLIKLPDVPCISL